MTHVARMACQVDALQPPLDAALAAMERFEWVGLTDLFEVGGEDDCDGRTVQS